MYVNSIRLYTLLLHLIHTITKFHSYDLGYTDHGHTLPVSNSITYYTYCTITHCTIELYLLLYKKILYSTTYLLRILLI